MPKINVYLPDELAAQVKEAGIPVSPVCQAALAEAVRKVGAARRFTAAIKAPGFDPTAHPRAVAGLAARLTARLAEVLRLARLAAGTAPAGTGALLAGMLEEGGNLGLQLLQVLGVELDELPAAVAAAGLSDGERAPAAGTAEEDGDLAGLTASAWAALATGLEASIEAGHNYIGCEHLMLGLLAEPDGAAGQLLRGLGADPAAAPRALATMLAGFAQGRQTALAGGGATGGAAIERILRRLDALEQRLEAGGGPATP